MLLVAAAVEVELVLEVLLVDDVDISKSSQRETNRGIFNSG
jgi:hypothetical protein